MRASLRPTYRALSGCLPRGAAVDVWVRIYPEAGRSAAEVDDPALARCVAGAMGAGTIPSFGIGSDCVDCGQAASSPTSTLILPLRFVRP
jgi:hypothetical protein